MAKKTPKKKASPKKRSPKKADRKKRPRNKAAKKPAELPQLEDTAELAGDGANPRKITDKAAAGLQNSLDRFGDLSGIVFNRRTGELVCGHQRMTQIRAKWGDRPIKFLPDTPELGVIDCSASGGIDGKGGHTYTVRIVDWSPAKQRGANVAANSQKISGEFTGELSDYLLEVQADLQEEMPGMLDDCLLVELMDVELEAAADQPVPTVYQVVVDVAGEEEQKELYERLRGDGFEVKLLTI